MSIDYIDRHLRKCDCCGKDFLCNDIYVYRCMRCTKNNGIKPKQKK